MIDQRLIATKESVRFTAADLTHPGSTGKVQVGCAAESSCQFEYEHELGSSNVRTCLLRAILLPLPIESQPSWGLSDLGLAK